MEDQELKPRKSNAGRHKKDCTCEKCEAKRGSKTHEPEIKQPEYKTPDPFTGREYLENIAPGELFSEYEVIQEDTPPVFSAPEPEPAQRPQVITGYLLLILVDTLIPLGLSFVAPKITKKEIPVRELKMTKEERDSLLELADAAAEQLNINVPPLQLFLISCTMIYGSKLMR